MFSPGVKRTFSGKGKRPEMEVESHNVVLRRLFFGVGWGWLEAVFLPPLVCRLTSFTEKERRPLLLFFLFFTGRLRRRMLRDTLSQEQRGKRGERNWHGSTGTNSVYFLCSTKVSKRGGRNIQSCLLGMRVKKLRTPRNNKVELIANLWADQKTAD